MKNLGWGVLLGMVVGGCNQVTGVGDIVLDPDFVPGRPLAGAVGMGPGNVVPVGLSWDGFAEKSSTEGTVAMMDWYDHDGSRGVDAILALTSAFDCAACDEEAAAIAARAATWSKKGWGVKVLALVLDDGKGHIATAASAGAWRSKHKLADVAVGADGEFTFAAGAVRTPPLAAVIDPRTMLIVSVNEGFSGGFDELEAVAGLNGGAK